MPDNPAAPATWRMRMLRALARTGLLLRTTAFRLAGLYLLVFILFAVFVLGYLDWSTRRLLDAQITETIETEIGNLADQYRQAGMRRLITVMERRGRQGNVFIYLLVDEKGDSVTGNALLRLPLLQQSPGWIEAEYNWPDESDEIERLAKIRIFVLPSGHRLFVGRDLEERERMKEVIARARGSTFLMVFLLGGFGAWFITRRVLTRIDAIAQSSGEILAGNKAERLPVSPVNDEFDRLARHINTLLDRTDALMAGLQDLSDNVAHDLRTPLTRLRNSIEDALRNAQSAEDSRAALEKAIEDSSQIIRIFDALLMIARAESGHLAPTLTPVDIGAVVEGMAELYEPLAEEAGLHLRVHVAPGLTVNASRELVGQALANLIDNALKYGLPLPDSGAEPVLTLSAEQVGEKVHIALADHGAGIPAGARARVLSRFVRLEKSRTQPGFGLGLSLVAAIMRLHGGSLSLEENSPGLKVTMIFPVAAQKSASE